MKTESNAADPSSAQINAFDVTFEREVYSNEERYEIEKGNCQTWLPGTEAGFVVKEDNFVAGCVWRLSH